MQPGADVFEHGGGRGVQVRVEVQQIDRPGMGIEEPGHGVGEPARAIANLTILTNTDIKGFPRFVHKLQQASVEISSHVLLPCEVAADPKPKIYWLS